MLQLVLVRHGEAAPQGSAGARTDFARPLTDRGREQVTLLGQFLASLRFQPQQIWHSPRVRTTETALILADQLGLSEVEPHQGLDCDDFDAPAFGDFLNSRDLKSSLIVGHNPDISAYCSWLCQHPWHSEFRPGTAAEVLFEGPIHRGMGRLVWMKHPGDY
jgi:phosphohistidine phosphatase